LDCQRKESNWAFRNSRKSYPGPKLLRQNDPKLKIFTGKMMINHLGLGMLGLGADAWLERFASVARSPDQVQKFRD